MEATLMEESQDIAGREDVQELRDMRTQGQFGSLVLVERSHFTDWNLALRCQRGNDTGLIGLILLQCVHGGFLG